MTQLNPESQYADDRNLRARQRLWELQDPPFDLVSWVLDIAEPAAGDHVLDVGCGNGGYLQALVARQPDRPGAIVGCDLSSGMLRAVRATLAGVRADGAPAAGGAPTDAGTAAFSTHPSLVNADVTTLPFAEDTFDVVLAPHMLYHVDDRARAAAELRRVLRSDGRCIVVTNGAGHVRALRDLVEAAVRAATPGWEMRSPVTHVFSLENGGEQLRLSFDDVTSVRPDRTGAVVVTDASVAADYVASTADHYQPETTRPWAEVVDHVRREVQAAIDATGAFVTRGDVGAFVCR